MAGCTNKSSNKNSKNQIGVVLHAPQPPQGSKLLLAESGSFLPLAVSLAIQASDGTVVRKSVRDSDELSFELSHGKAAVQASFLAIHLPAGQTKAQFCEKTLQQKGTTSSSAATPSATPVNSVTVVPEVSLSPGPNTGSGASSSGDTEKDKDVFVAEYSNDQIIDASTETLNISLGTARQVQMQKMGLKFSLGSGAPVVGAKVLFLDPVSQ